MSSCWKAKAIGSGLSQLERLFDNDNKVTGQEMVGGRNAWRMESEPKTGLKAANPGEDEILATHRITWFDEEEGVELRYRTVYTRRIHSIQAGTLDENE